MTGSPSKSFGRRLGLIAGVGGIVLSAAVAAQTPQPLQPQQRPQQPQQLILPPTATDQAPPAASGAPAALAPPTMLRPQRSLGPAPDAPPAAEPKSVNAGEPAVQVDSLGQVDLETVGTLTPANGGLGGNLWQGTDRDFVERMLVQLPVKAPSPTMRGLMRRLLLTAAVPPKRASAPGDAAPQDAGIAESLISKRVKMLAGMGDVTGVGELLAAVPGNVTDPSLLTVEADARFLANDNARACGIAAQQILVRDTPYWQKSMIFCQILAGDPAKAELGLTMMNELGTRAPQFVVLADRLLGGQGGDITSISGADGLILAMARAAEAPLPEDAGTSDNPGVLRAISVNPNVSADIRLEAAERAEAAGALDTEALRQLYSSVKFEPGDLSKPLSRAQEIGGPRARALLYHAALSQTVPTAQAEIISQALAIAVAEGRYGAAARVFQPLVANITPSQALLWFARDAVRLMLSNQSPDGAKPWLQLLQASALFHKDSVRELLRLTPLARLVGAIGLENEPRDLDAWWKTVKDDAGAARKAARLYGLLSGLGETLPLSTWRTLAAPAEEKRGAGKPAHPALLFRLAAVTEAVRAWKEEQRMLKEQAAEALEAAPEGTAGVAGAAPTGIVQAGLVSEVSTAAPGPAQSAPQPPHRGEVLLMVLAAIGDQGPGLAPAIALRQAVTSLRVIGLEKEARALALEAALAAGL